MADEASSPDVVHGDKTSYFADFTTTTKKGDSSVVGTVWQVLLWKEPKWSAAVLAVGLAWFYATTLGGYTVLSLFSVLMLLNLVLSIIVSIVSAWYGDGLPDKKAPQVETAAVKQAVGVVAVEVNRFLKFYSVVLHGKNLMGALQVIGILFITYVVGRWFTAYTLLFIVYIGAFCGPVAYDANKAVVDAHVAKVKLHLDKAIEKVGSPAKDKKKE